MNEVTVSPTVTSFRVPERTYGVVDGQQLDGPGDDEHPAVVGARITDAVGAARVDGDLDHRHGPAHHRRGVQRLRPVRVGRHRLHRRGRHQHAVARPVLRHLRPPHHPAGRARPVHRRLPPVWTVAEHEPAHRLPSHPGVRRRRDPGAGVRRARRHPPAPRARTVHRLLHAGLRRRGAVRSADRRLHHRTVVVAVDLLHQRPARRDRRPSSAGSPSTCRSRAGPRASTSPARCCSP